MANLTATYLGEEALVGEAAARPEIEAFGITFKKDEPVEIPVTLADSIRGNILFRVDQKTLAPELDKLHADLEKFEKAAREDKSEKELAPTKTRKTKKAPKTEAALLKEEAAELDDAAEHVQETTLQLDESGDVVEDEENK